MRTFVRRSNMLLLSYVLFRTYSAVEVDVLYFCYANWILSLTGCCGTRRLYLRTALRDIRRYSAVRLRKVKFCSCCFLFASGMMRPALGVAWFVTRQRQIPSISGIGRSSSSQWKQRSWTMCVLFDSFFTLLLPYSTAEGKRNEYCAWCGVI